MNRQDTTDDNATGCGEKRDLVFSRTFAVPVERVWEAWTDPERVMLWWGPNGFTCSVAEMDFREGGKSLLCMRASKEVRNVVTFKAVSDERTEMTVTEYDWPVGQLMEMCIRGMEQCLEKMAASFVSNR